MQKALTFIAMHINFSKLFKKLQQYLNDFKQFWAEDIWRLDFSKVSRIQKIILSHLLIWQMVLRAYIKDRLPVRASALTYATLLSFMPILAVLFSILKGFGFHKQLEPLMLEFITSLRSSQSLKTLGNEQAVTTFLDNLQTDIVPGIIEYLDHLQVGAMGTVGLILLLFSVMSMVNNIEQAFNDIWQLKKARSIQRAVSDYLSFLLLWPFLVVILPSANAYMQGLKILEPLNQHKDIRFFLFSWLVFFFIYVFLPNTKVRFVSAAWGGLIAGTLFQITNKYFSQFILTSYQTGPRAVLYTSFAFIPLILIWLYLSWSVVLLGAEITHSHQNRIHIVFDVKRPEFSWNFTQRTSLKIILYISQKFDHGNTPPTIQEISEFLKMPIPFAQELLNNLLDVKLVYAVADDEPAYLPVKSLENLTVAEIIHTLQNKGSGTGDFGEGELETLVKTFEKQYNTCLKKSFSTSTIHELIKKVESS